MLTIPSAGSSGLKKRKECDKLLLLLVQYICGREETPNYAYMVVIVLDEPSW
jgi:hypothetical protein